MRTGFVLKNIYKVNFIHLLTSWGEGERENWRERDSDRERQWETEEIFNSYNIIKLKVYGVQKSNAVGKWRLGWEPLLACSCHGRVIVPGNGGEFQEQKRSGGHGPGRRLMRVRGVQGDPGEQRDRNPECRRKHACEMHPRVTIIGHLCWT